MVRRWRIRHKLTLGLALVVGIMLLILAGTLKGLLSYRSTMKTIDSRQDELRAAQDLQVAVGPLTAIAQRDEPADQELPNKIAAARQALHRYEQHLQSTLSRKHDSDNGSDEKQIMEKLRDDLDALHVLAQKQPAGEMQVSTPGDRNRIDPSLKDLLQRVGQKSADLRGHIHSDLSRRIVTSKQDYKASIALVSVTCLIGALLMLGLTRLAYRWIAYPIRQLHEQVGRLAEGDFDSRIRVQSGDEIQELADSFNDMTDRLQHIYRDLARQVNERSRQLVRSERLAGVGFLAAGVAHEINNPLASIAFCGEALERRLRDAFADRAAHPDLETITNYLSMIQQEAFRCKEITQRLLEFSRVGERKRQITDMVELVQSVIDMVLHLQSYKGKQIVFEAAQRPKALVNAPEIKSVVLNLAVNALESMDEGGVLTIGLSTRDGMAEVSFTDTGCGMTAEVLDNIFEPFFTRSRTGKGTGLGLSISHRVITQHGGDIEAASLGPNQGSTFTVRLPLNPAAELRPLKIAA